jgi:enoyl-[acyl-carrier-protein] reductase (NADH)
LLSAPIAFGVAGSSREGAELAFTYQNERFGERVADMAAEFGSHLVFRALQRWEIAGRSPNWQTGTG